MLPTLVFIFFYYYVNKRKRVATWGNLKQRKGEREREKVFVSFILSFQNFYTSTGTESQNCWNKIFKKKLKRKKKNWFYYQLILGRAIRDSFPNIMIIDFLLLNFDLKKFWRFWFEFWDLRIYYMVIETWRDCGRCSQDWNSETEKPCHWIVNKRDDEEQKKTLPWLVRFSTAMYSHILTLNLISIS